MNQRPVIPQDEFVSRQRKVQQWMKENGLDLFVAFADDRAVYGPAYARWLCNYAPAFEPCLVFLPAEGELAVLTGPESEDYVYASSYCKKVNIISEFSHPDEEYPYTEVTPLANVVRQLRKEGDIRKVGVAGFEGIPHKLYTALQSVFGDDAMMEIDHHMMSFRAVKSEHEIRVIEYAYSIAEQGLQAAIQSIAEGKSEREIAAEAEYVMRKLGSEGMGIDTMVASGVQNTYPILSRTTTRQMKQGDFVVLTLAPRYEGYHGAVATPVFIGKPDQQIEEALLAAVKAQQAAMDTLRPGTAGYVVDRAARQVMEQAGLGKHFVYTGIHSVGMIEFESPILTSAYQGFVQENMIFSIDIPIFMTSWGGLRIERGFHITKDGARPLQSFEPGIICV